MVVVVVIVVDVVLIVEVVVVVDVVVVEDVVVNGTVALTVRTSYEPQSNHPTGDPKGLPVQFMPPVS